MDLLAVGQGLEKTRQGTEPRNKTTSICKLVSPTMEHFNLALLVGSKVCSDVDSSAEGGAMSRCGVGLMACMLICHPIS